MGVLIWSIATPHGATGQRTETFEYVIEEGDTCAKIARKFFGPRRWDIIHKYNPNMGPTPHRLVPGQKLTLPRPDESADAELTAVQRAVQSREPDKTDWRRAKKGDDLYRGWRVNTLESSAAELTFRDESIVQMRENTLVIIYGGSSQAARRQTSKAELERGELRSRLGELRLEVTTPSATADLEGGSSLVSVDKAGASRLSHHEGVPAKLRTKKGRAVSVKPGFGSKLAKGESRPSKPRRLPPAPAWTSTNDRVFTGLAGIGGSIAAQWKEVGKAESYRVEIARSKTGKQLVASLTIPATVRQFEAHGLPEGTYFARVSTVDKAAFESRQSRTLRMVVKLMEVLSPGAKKPLKGGGAADVSEAQKARTLVGTQLTSPDGFACAVGDAKRAKTIALMKPGMSTITCTGPNNVSAEIFSLEVVAPRLVLADESVTPTFRRGEPQRLSLQVQSALPLPDNARLSAPKTVELRDKGLSGDARTVELVASDATPERFPISLVVGSGDDIVTLTQLELHVEDAGSGQVPAPPFEPQFAPNEALGLALNPNILALRNDRREGSGLFVSVSYNGKRDNRYGRATYGFEVAPSNRIRLGIASVADFAENGTVPAARGDLDLFSWISYRFVRDRALSLDAEIAAWFPTTDNASSIDRVRLVPSLHFSWDIDSSVLLRMRQGAILNMGSGGPFFWASAYGADIKIVRYFAFAAELDLIVGKLEDTAVSDVGLGAGFSALAGPASLYLMARYGFGDDIEDLVGRITLSFAIRLSFR